MHRRGFQTLQCNVSTKANTYILHIYQLLKMLQYVKSKSAINCRDAEFSNFQICILSPSSPTAGSAPCIGFLAGIKPVGNRQIAEFR